MSMNTTTIRTRVAELVPTAEDIATTYLGRGVYSLTCRIAGYRRAVLFDSTGIYGRLDLSGLGNWPKSDLALAAEIAKELA